MVDLVIESIERVEKRFRAAIRSSALAVGLIAAELHHRWHRG
jgi:hypothetical protein